MAARFHSLAVTMPSSIESSPRASSMEARMVMVTGFHLSPLRRSPPLSAVYPRSVPLCPVPYRPPPMSASPNPSPAGPSTHASVRAFPLPPAGFKPWFDIAGRRTRDALTIFGHWSTLGVMVRDDVIALDSGCVWGGALTAIRLEDQALFQVPCPQSQRPGNTKGAE